MGYTIAITGKGGTGKTTISSLLIAGLVAAGRVPVLAVDADPNSCLDTALGVRVCKSVGTVREEARSEARDAAAAGLAKRELLEMKIAESLVESRDFDLIAMGRPEGPGCYCYANNVLRDVIAELSGSYPYIVIDNEAGLENLSRRIVQKVDVLVLAGDPSAQSANTLRRLHALAGEMGIAYERLAVVVNRVRGALPPAFGSIAEEIGAHHFIAIPDDETVARTAEAGTPLSALPADNPAVAAVRQFIQSILKENHHG